MRMIDADALKRKSVPLLFPTKMEPCGHIPVPVNAVVVAEIEQASTIDAVPVVRCWECKHFRHYGKTSLFINGKNIKAGWCQRRVNYDEEYRMTEDDFCSYGERKEGAE